MRTRVAGITFKNEVEDGGNSRQDILASLYESSPRHIITVDLKETTYDGERAIKCFEHKTKQCIGWIPKKDIASVEHSQMTGFINKSKKRFKNVTLAKCKNCNKYRPRKSGKKQESIKAKRQKDRDRHDNWKNY